MEFKSFLAGIFFAYGVGNLLDIMNIPFAIKLGINVFGIDLGSLLLAILSLIIAFYLVKGK
ncbi:MAG: hypothetical protein N3E37_00460 [Candidatus Micrarchaeota archaeon]|nr:hypothetical protein [Candidatus Micrarchaeota archaeon]